MAAFISTQRDDAVPSESVAEFVYTLVEDDAFSFTHGFAEKPRQCEVYIRCVTTEVGYAVGDEVEINSTDVLTLAVNKTQVKVALNGLPSIVDAAGSSAAAVTAANWNLVFKFEL